MTFQTILVKTLTLPEGDVALGKTFFPLGTPVFSSGTHRLNGHLARLLEVERTQVNGLEHCLLHSRHRGCDY